MKEASSARLSTGRRMVERYLNGHRPALRRVDEWIDVVLRRSYPFLREEWDDLRQEIRMRVLRNLSLGRFRGHSELRTYVHRIAKNVCIDCLRRKRREREHRERIPPTCASDNREEAGCLARDQLRAIVAALTSGERRLVRLVFLEHLSYDEVARVLGISESAVKSKVFRCRRRILRLGRRA